MPLPSDLLEAISSTGGGRVALVIGAGCSLEEPTGLPLSREVSREIHRMLVADGILDHGECADPDDLSAVTDAFLWDGAGALTQIVTVTMKPGRRKRI